jgi:hypothetical protein
MNKIRSHLESVEQPGNKTYAAPWTKERKGGV